MFIIKEGKGYKIVGDKAYEIEIGQNGQIVVTDKAIEIEKSDVLYTYDEMYRKLNIAYFANSEIVEVEPEKEPELEQNPDEGANDEPEKEPEKEPENDTLKESKKNK